MERGRALMMQAAFLVMVIGMQFRGTSYAKAKSHDLCSSSCGSIRNITSPFRLQTDPSYCGDFRYELSCENDLTVLHLPVGSLFRNSSDPEEYQSYYVQAIDYNNYTIRLVDPNIQKDDFCSIPSNTLYDLAVPLPIYDTVIWLGKQPWSFDRRQISGTVIFFTCESRVLNSSYIDASPCVFNRTFSSETSPPSFLSSSKQYYSYYYIFDDDSFSPRELDESCWIEQTSLVSKGHVNKKPTSNDIHNLLVYGFELSWVSNFATTEVNTCYVDEEDSNRVRCINFCKFPDYGVRIIFRCGLFYKFLYYLELYLYYKGAYKYIGTS